MNSIIAVTEYNNREAPGIFAVIDRARFLELYGDYDLRMLEKNGIHGDAIGQGRYYYAKLLTDKIED